MFVKGVLDGDGRSAERLRLGLLCNCGPVAHKCIAERVLACAHHGRGSQMGKRTKLGGTTGGCQVRFKASTMSTHTRTHLGLS